MDKKLDLTKPVQTRDGQPARIVCTDMRGAEGKSYILALLSDKNGHEWSGLYHENGAVFLDGRPDPSDLVNVPGKKGAWFNIYRCPSFYKQFDADGHKTKERADSAATPYRLACVYVEWEE